MHLNLGKWVVRNLGGLSVYIGNIPAPVAIVAKAALLGGKEDCDETKKK